MSLSSHSSFVSDNHEEAVAENDDSLARIADGPSQEAPTPCMLLEVPVEVMGIIFKFQAHKDRISLGTTCNDILKRVEAFSQRRWREIGERGDDTWEARLRDTSEVIKTEVPHSLLELPQRFLLARAYRTHLYSMTDPRREEVLDGRVLPGGETLAVVALAGRNVVCNVWDLNTRQCVRTFNLTQEEEEDMVLDTYVSFCGEHLVAYFAGFCSIYSIFSGELLHRHFHYDQPDSWVLSLAGDEKRVFFTCHGSFIYCLDIASGVVRKGEVFVEGTDWKRFTYVEVSEGLVIAHLTSLAPDNQVDDAVGMYVLDYNGGEYSVLHSFPGQYDNFKKARDDPALFAAFKINGRVDVLKLVDGRFTCITTFMTDASCGRGMGEIRLVSDSKIYIEWSDGKVVVFSAVTGERLHTVFRPARCSLPMVDSNGNELFCIHSPFNIPRRDGFPTTIQAYCLPE